LSGHIEQEHQIIGCILRGATSFAFNDQRQPVRWIPRALAIST